MHGICLNRISKTDSVAYGSADFGILGQARVNVLELNLALDRGGK